MKPDVQDQENDNNLGKEAAQNSHSQESGIRLGEHCDMPEKAGKKDRREKIFHIDDNPNGQDINVSSER